MDSGQRIRIGNQTAFSAERVTLPFEFAVEQGFDAFEWFPDKKESGAGWTVRDIPADIRASIKETAETRDIRLSVHAPWPSDPLREDAAPSFHETIGFAREIGASLFTVHLRTDRGIEAYAEALRPFTSLLEEAGIGLAIENTISTSPGELTRLFRHLRETGADASSHVGVCLDLGHANLSAETRNDYLRFVDMLGAEVPIVHVHLHENFGDQDSHLTVFTGPAASNTSGIRGFVERLRERRFSGCIILEQWPKPEQLLVEARNRLIEMIGAIPEPTQGRKNNLPVKDVALQFVEANSRFLSWRKRLEWVLELLTDSVEKPGPELLTYIAVYLRFLGTGELRYGEDGGHYRPSHNANISRHLYERLVAVASADNRFIARKIYPWLPSFDSEFRRSEPLTLIRDIAHRNDIPRELKQEIKTTLQNKLHRSAGPEDLAVSSALLEKITAPGAAYPEAFVAEFRRFHEELKDFFNAGSLKDLLLRIIERNEFGDVPLLREFLSVLDRPGKGLETLKALELLTEIRTHFAPEILSDKGPAGLRLQIADIRLEDHSFVLLSIIVNAMEHRLSREKMPWKTALRASALALANIRLGGFDAEECAATEAELESLSSVFDPRRRDSLLRLKASADRCLRLAESYRDKILALFPEKAEILGRALGVSEHAIRVYAEADIRSHPVFQLSKLALLLLKEIREAASLPFWDVIVPGTAAGQLLTIDSLLSLPVTHEGPAIVLADRAAGEEEIAPYVTGIVVTVETPLLSHLAVRARQNGTVFIFCGDEKRISEIRAFSGKAVSLAAAGGNFRVSSAELTNGAELGGPYQRAGWPEAPPIEYPGDGLIAPESVTPSTGGGKAYGVRKLAEISKAKGAGFAIPRGLVVPFGAMETSLRSSPVLAEEYTSLSREIDRMSPPDQETSLGRLKEITMQLMPSGEVLSGVARHFRKDSRLMVRSSSNCEDAEGMAGAGIYDSIANVPVSETAVAISKVWASLWNRRALDARRKAGVLHEACHMAVLIQTVIPADISFVMHTVNPVSGDENEILMELAAGLGETLVSGREPGSPFRMVYNKNTGHLEMLSFASYSFLSRPALHGGTIRERVDYSAMPFSRDDDFRRKVATQIGEAGRLVERALGKPQDIEGAVKGGEIYLVQARPQQTGRKEYQA